MNARLIAAVVIALVLAGTHWKAYVMGKDTVQAKWDADKLKQEQLAARDALRKQNVIDAEAHKFAEKATKDRVVTVTLIKEVEKYVPNTLPMLPGDFRLYHDAAAAGTEVDNSRRADAAPVAPRSVAATLAENYASCNYDKFRLGVLQEIVRTMQGDDH